MKRSLFRLLYLLRVPSLLRRFRRGRIAILMYHGFTDRGEAQGIQNIEGLHVHTGKFSAQLEYLTRHYNVVSLNRVVEHLTRETPLPPNPVVLTADDGYRSNYKLAFPLLKKWNAPMTVFVTTGFVGSHSYQWTDRLEYAVDRAAGSPATLRAGTGEITLNPNGPESRTAFLIGAKKRLKQVPQESRAALIEEFEQRVPETLAGAEAPPEIYQPLDWTEAREMADSGLVSIGSHTVSHYILTLCAPENVRGELATAKATIEERLERPCPLFCYPNGGVGDFSEDTGRMVRELGHTCALTTIPGFNTEKTDRYELKRLAVMNHEDDLDFAMTLCGVASFLSGLKSKLRRVLGRGPADAAGMGG